MVRCNLSTPEVVELFGFLLSVFLETLPTRNFQLVQIRHFHWSTSFINIHKGISLLTSVRRLSNRISFPGGELFHKILHKQDGWLCGQYWNNLSGIMKVKTEEDLKTSCEKECAHQEKEQTGKRKLIVTFSLKMIIFMT